MPDKIRLGRHFEEVAMVCTACSAAITGSNLFLRPGAKMLVLARLGHTLEPHECLEVTIKTGLENGEPVRCDCSCHESTIIEAKEVSPELLDRRELSRAAFYGENEPLLEFILHARGYWQEGQFYPADGLSLRETITFVEKMGEELERFRRLSQWSGGHSPN